MLPTFKLCLKNDYIKKDGTVNIRIRISYRRVTKYFPLGVHVLPGNFINGTVSRKDPLHWRKNILLTRFLEKASRIIFELEMSGQPFTFNGFEALFLDEDYGNHSFESFAKKYIRSQKGIVSINTTRMYQSQLNKLMEFSPGLKFGEITSEFINNFERFLINCKKNNQNTRIKTFTVLKAILNHAKDDGLIRDHALEDYKIGTIEGNREFLTIDELQILERLFTSGELNKRLANVLRYFLFSCYTGLRYQDIRDLRCNDIINGQDLSVKMNKTGKTIRVPLSDKARGILPDHQFKNQKVFKVLSNQPTNRYLKDIMDAAGIQKKISFHCSRHTFATVSLDLGVSMETVKDILGHTDFKTTAIYARIRDGKKRQEIGLWDRKRYN